MKRKNKSLGIEGKDRATQTGCSGSERIKKLERYRDLQEDGIFMQE